MVLPAREGLGDFEVYPEGKGVDLVGCSEDLVARKNLVLEETGQDLVQLRLELGDLV